MPRPASTPTGQNSSRAALLPVAFSGAPGAYSEQAARRFFGPRSATLTCGAGADALQAVAGGRARNAVLPVENTITGCFAGLTEELFQHDVAVVGEVLVPIRHCLLGAPGSQLDDIAVVTSHPSALAQCRDWLATWGVATRPAPDTAAAAAELSQSADAALGVLGSRVLAEIYGLEILAEGLSDRDDNRTRFYVFGAASGAGGDDAERGSAEGSVERSALLVGPVQAPRALKTLRIRLEAYEARRVRVPFLGSEDGTRFLVEFDHRPGAGAELAASACDALEHRFLGSWAVSG